MNRLDLLDRLAQHRQHLDATRRAITLDLADTYPDAVARVADALNSLGDALARLDRPTVTPETPWIGATMADRLTPPTYTTGA